MDNNVKAKSLNVAFWSKESGNLMSHSKGLDAEQIKFLQELRVGDRLVIFFNRDKRGETSPDYSLKQYAAKPKNDDEF